MRPDTDSCAESEETYPDPSSVETQYSTPNTGKTKENSCHGPRLNEDQRKQWIAVAAYFKAESRGFLPGFELEDWCYAEQQYHRYLVDEFIRLNTEDEGMTLSGLRKLAFEVGVDKPEKVDSMPELIRLIQNACHHSPCFRIRLDSACESRSACQWYGECQKLVAEYWR